MNREIKFKIWDKFTKTMSEPFEISELIFDWKVIWMDRFKGQREIVGSDMIYLQFTGLLDKNGKEIYEGDIDNKKRVCEYFPSLGSFGFKHKYYPHITLMGQFINSGGEIIGNIYENPELLTND
jgi:hypothetical protein